MCFDHNRIQCGPQKSLKRPLQACVLVLKWDYLPSMCLKYLNEFISLAYYLIGAHEKLSDKVLLLQLSPQKLWGISEVDSPRGWLSVHYARTRVYVWQEHTSKMKFFCHQYKANCLKLHVQAHEYIYSAHPTAGILATNIIEFSIDYKNNQ